MLDDTHLVHFLENSQVDLMGKTHASKQVLLTYIVIKHLTQFGLPQTPSVATWQGQVSYFPCAANTRLEWQFVSNTIQSLMSMPAAENIK